MPSIGGDFACKHPTRGWIDLDHSQFFVVRKEINIYTYTNQIIGVG
jgi:hypothetical protein